MITWKMCETLNEINKQEERKGVATAPEITTYKDRSTLYRCLDRLHQLEAIEKQKAPNTKNLEHTYTTTQFGRTLLQKKNKIEK